VQGKDWFSQFLPEYDQPRIRELFLKAVTDIQTRANVNSIVTKDGRELMIEWYDKTLKDDKGNVFGLLAIGQDITERKRLEEEVLKARKLESVGILAGGIAHDFNNLLQAIMGNVALATMYVQPGDKAFQRLTEAGKVLEQAKELSLCFICLCRWHIMTKRQPPQSLHYPASGYWSWTMSVTFWKWRRHILRRWGMRSRQ
jgi:hypothetical protein